MIPLLCSLFVFLVGGFELSVKLYCSSAARTENPQKKREKYCRYTLGLLCFVEPTLSLNVHLGLLDVHPTGLRCW